MSQEAAWVLWFSYLPGPGLIDLTSGYCFYFPKENFGFDFSRIFFYPLKSSGIVVYWAGDGPWNLLSRPLANDISSSRCFTRIVSWPYFSKLTDLKRLSGLDTFDFYIFGIGFRLSLISWLKIGWSLDLDALMNDELPWLYSCGPGLSLAFFHLVSVENVENDCTLRSLFISRARLSIVLNSWALPR